MEPTKDGERFYIFTRMNLGEDAKQIHADLAEVYKDTACSYRTVTGWMRKFREGRQSFEDLPRAGRPNEAVNDRNMDTVRNMIKKNPHISVFLLFLNIGVSVGSVETIIHEHLKFRKVCAKWVPHKLTEIQKRSRVDSCKEMLKLFEPNGPKRLSDIVTGDESWFNYCTTPRKSDNCVWVSEDEPRPHVLWPDFRSRKRMFTIFFNSRGPVCVDVLPEKMTITGQYYTNIVLPKMVKEMTEQRPATGTARVLLLHDNASSHKTKMVSAYLDQEKIKQLPHPPYSPDLAPCDFWLFPKIKKQLAGKPFGRVQDLAKAIHSEMRSIPQEDYAHAFSNWRNRLQLCIDAGGEYFEGL